MRVLLQLSCREGQNCTSPSGYNFQKSFLSGVYNLHWSLNVTDGTLHVGIEARTPGWVGFGIAAGTPSHMIGSEVAIGWAYTPVPTIHSWLLVDRVIDDLYTIDSLIPLSNASICQYVDAGGATWTVFNYTRSIVAGTNPISLTDYTPAVLAYGPDNKLVQHNSDAMEPFQINFLTGAVKESLSPTTIKDLRISHGFIMTFAFGIIMPLAMMVARYGKNRFGDNWILIHFGMQTTAYFFGLIGFTIALIMANKIYFNTIAHGQMGMTVIVAALVQLSGGLLRPHRKEGAEKQTRIRIFWEWFHPWFGRTVILFAIITIFFGIYQYQAPFFWYIIYGVILGLIATACIILEIRQCVANRKEPKDKPLKDDHHDDL